MRAMCDKVSPAFTVYVLAELADVLGALVFVGVAAGAETAAELGVGPTCKVVLPTLREVVTSD